MSNSSNLAVTFYFIAVSSLLAQPTDSGDYAKKKKFNALEERSKTTYKFVPTPSFDPSTKWGITGIAMANYYIDKQDTLSPPSVSSLVGWATTNSSWGAGMVQTLNFNQDKWRLRANVFYGEINQDLEIGNLPEINSTRLMTIANVSGKRRLLKRLFLGLGYSFRSIEYEGRNDEADQLLEQLGFTDKVDNHGLKYFLNLDSRDNIFYPYKGVYVEYTLGQNFDNGTSTEPNDYLENLVDLRHFITLVHNTDHVLAWHLFGRFLTGNPTNENYSFYGRSAVLVQRGYETGTFIDRDLVTGEVEYRRETPWMKRKLGFVGFMGLGKVFGDYHSFRDAEWLPAIGVGARYRVLDYERMNFRADIAYGKDGWTVYFGIREAF